MITTRFQRRKFIIAKAARNTLNGLLQRNYKKNFELALIASIVVTILSFRVAANLDVRKYLEMKREVKFEFIDIPEIPQVVEEPPKIKMQELVEIPPEPEEKIDSDDLLNEVEKLLGENQDEVALEIAANDNNNLINDSQMNLVSGSQLKIRNRRSYEDGGVRLGDREVSNDLLTESNLDIGSTGLAKKKLVTDNSNLDLGSNDRQKNDIDNGKLEEDDIKLGLNGRAEKVLNFSSSTIGTEDYKLWNKIISELDRLNKGRYGNVPKELKRNSRGFLISFGYSDRTLQEINWRNDGNVWIKVVGESKKTAIQELRRALNGLLQLSLNN